VYQWERIEDAKAFYTGPWLEEARLICSRRPLPPNASEKISLIFRANWRVEIAVALWRMAQSPRVDVGSGSCLTANRKPRRRVERSG
jgi:hypothetical protein